jgi:endonuclease III
MAGKGTKDAVRRERAARIVAALRELYPVPKTELRYRTPFQLVVAVMLSAQCTDKRVNEVTKELYRKYRSVDDFADADLAALTTELSTISYYRTKARHVIGAAKVVRERFKGRVPKTEAELRELPGVAYKSAHVIAGELFGAWEGIPTDTHVKRFARKFDLTDQTDLTKISKDLERLIPKEDWGFVNNGLVLYGRYVCKARPHECADHALTRLWPEAANRWPSAS